jgi:tRNA(Ile2) C34 agmatinyltransferase TiaS
MKPVKIKCPECNHSMEYWTQNDFIFCTKCKAKIDVEPCKEELTEDEEEVIDEEPVEE